MKAMDDLVKAREQVVAVAASHDATLVVVERVVRSLIDAIEEQDGYEPTDAADVEVRVVQRLQDVLDELQPDGGAS